MITAYTILFKKLLENLVAVHGFKVHRFQVSGVWLRVSGSRKNAMANQSYVYGKDLEVENKLLHLIEECISILSLF